ncbi:MAG: hypothetical protein EHM47_11345 [Ignavibacteriales bacterium]|nr:MAG: hypothetical protein EHM47_11345 [Ignavibacteriales bacterium]
MKSLDEILQNKINGMYYGNRVLLPFHFTALKIVIEKDIITDFSIRDKGAYVNEHHDYTEIYFMDYPDLETNISKYETIKMVIVEKGKDIFDFSTHRKIAIRPEGSHVLSIKEIDENTIFIE